MIFIFIISGQIIITFSLNYPSMILSLSLNFNIYYYHVICSFTLPLLSSQSFISVISLPFVAIFFSFSYKLLRAHLISLSVAAIQEEYSPTSKFFFFFLLGICNHFSWQLADQEGVGIGAALFCVVGVWGQLLVRLEERVDSRGNRRGQRWESCPQMLVLIIHLYLFIIPSIFNQKASDMINYNTLSHLIQLFISKDLYLFININLMNYLTRKNVYKALSKEDKEQNEQLKDNGQIVKVKFISLAEQEARFIVSQFENYNIKLLLFSMFEDKRCLEVLSTGLESVCLIEPYQIQPSFQYDSRTQQERQQKIQDIEIQKVKLELSSHVLHHFRPGRIYYLKRYIYTSHILRWIVGPDQQRIRSESLFRILKGENIKNRLDQSFIKEPIIGNQNQSDSQQNSAFIKAREKLLLMITGPAGVGKTKICCKIANDLMQNDIGSDKFLKVLLTTVNHIGVGAIANQLFKELEEKKVHKKDLIRQLANYMKHFHNIGKIKHYQEFDEEKLQFTKRKMEFEIRCGLNQTAGNVYDYQQISRKNILYFIPLMTFERYSILHPVERYYQFNTHLIRNILLLREDYGLQLVMRRLDKIASVGRLWQKDQVQFHKVYLMAVRKTIREADCIIIQSSLIPYINQHQEPNQRFQPHTVLLDQASTANIAHFLAALYLQPKQLILAGDLKQLPQFSKNQSTGRRDEVQQSSERNNRPENILNRKVFEMLLENYQDSVVYFNTNYRNHEQIAYFLSDQVYDEHKIISKKWSVQNRTVFEQQHAPFQMIYYENSNDVRHEVQQNTGYYNLYEIAVIKFMLRNFKNEQFQEVGIICYYSEQVSRLNKILKLQIRMGLSVSTVDGFQGGEKKYIYLSLVRSVHPHQALPNVSQINEVHKFTVAMSRSIESLTIIGSIKTITRTDRESLKFPWRNVVSYLNKQNKLYIMGVYEPQILMILNQMNQTLSVVEEYKPIEMNNQRQLASMLNQEDIVHDQLGHQAHLSFPFLQYRHIITKK